MIFLRSLTPEVTAEKLTQAALADRAMICARVVLPLPGGPQKISERSFPEVNMPFRSFPGPNRCSWPTNCSKLAGRILTASGCEDGCCFAIGADPKRSMGYMLTYLDAADTGRIRRLLLAALRWYR